MPTWVTATIAAVALLALPAAATAAAAPAAATVTGCGGDHVTVVGKVKLSGKAAGKVRGANLQMQFQALPLFGIPHTGAWRDMGKKAAGSGQEVFTGLDSDSWAGLVRWRFKKGSRTVASGAERSQPLKIGSVKGAAFCTLFEGLKPSDTTPPTLFILPDNAVWHHGPTLVYLLAQDDFSGVQSVRYSLDGGPITPIRNGGTFTIDGEGAHNVQWAATDVAGNTATRTATVNVDQAPPTKPVLQRPFSVTVSTTPTFQWTPSTDSGSGLKGYFLVIKRASDGSTVSFTPFDPNTTSAVSPQALADGETYIASVAAVDNTDDPFTSESDPLTFRVDTHPDVTASNPGDGAIVSGNAKNGPYTLTLDRPADPASVTNGTVVLHRVEGSDPSYSVSCNSDCTVISVQPSSPSEGRYTLSPNGVRSQEGAAFSSSPVHFALAFREDNDSDNKATNSACTGATVTVTDGTPTANTLTAPSDENGRVTFGYSVTGSGSGGLRVLRDATVIADSSTLTGSGSGATLSFTILGDGNPHAYTTQYYSTCALGGSATTFTASNIVASRVP